MRRLSAALPLLLLLLGVGGPAAALDFDTFECITDNSATNCAAGEAQLAATLVESGADALLTLTMTGPANGVVEQLWIDSLLVTGVSFDGSTEGGIVAFGDGVTGGNLPGGNPVGFDSDWNIAAEHPGPKYGIGRHNQDDVSPQGAAFLIRYDGDFAELLADLKIGVHVIGFDRGSSEAFTSIPVPEPGSFALVSLGLTTIIAARRQRSRRRA
jgi:hypothetical protein